jgi:hypothetical protein
MKTVQSDHISTLSFAPTRVAKQCMHLLIIIVIDVCSMKFIWTLPLMLELINDFTLSSHQSMSVFRVQSYQCGEVFHIVSVEHSLVRSLARPRRNREVFQFIPSLHPMSVTIDHKYAVCMCSVIE